MADTNPLISSATSNLEVSLHPLVLLTISDSITRNSIRQSSYILVGALLGQQRGREITIEHAFDCSVTGTEEGIILQHDWFESRLQQYRDVHKEPTLDLVGWYALAPRYGPTSALLPIHRQIAIQIESPLFLAFHASELSGENENTESANKLPISLYETVQGPENPTAEDTNSKATAMQIDGEDVFDFKFRPVPYSIETDETEMIGINYVAKGGGNATIAGSGANTSKQAQTLPSQKPETRASLRASTKESNGDAGSSEGPPQKSTNVASMKADETILSALESDQVASLGTRLNSVKMLQSRLQLLQNFLSSLPESYISNGELSNKFLSENETSQVRSIAALLKQLSLLTPKVASPSLTVSTTTASSPRTPDSTLHSSSLAQRNDSALLDVLSTLTNTIQSASEVGRKHSAIESARQQAKSKKQSGGLGSMGHTLGGNGFGTYGSENGASNAFDEGYEGEASNPWQ